MTTEIKAVSRLDCKLLSIDDDAMTFSGYGAVFNNTDHHGDLIVHGAFKASLKAHKAAGTSPMMFLNHDAFGSLPIGTWSEMSEDGTGLAVKGKLLPTTLGRDVYTALKAGAIDGLSIGYRAIEWSTRNKPDEPYRTLKQLDLFEVSVVTIPANAKARVAAVKSINDTMDVRDLEGLLRELGLSKSESIRVASQFKSVPTADLAEKIVQAAAINRLIDAMTK